MRATITTILTLAILAVDVCAAATTPKPSSVEASGGHGDSAAVRDLHDDLGAYFRRWRDDEELLGKRRRRELHTARYHLSREDTSFRLVEDDPDAFAETLDIVESTLWKLTRERLLRDLRFDRLRRPFGRSDSADPEQRWRISPRIGLSHDPYLGANLRLRGDDLPSRFTLGLRQRLESGEESFFVQYEDGDRLGRLEQIFDHEDYGDQTVVSVRWQW